MSMLRSRSASRFGAVKSLRAAHTPTRLAVSLAVLFALSACATGGGGGGSSSASADAITRYGDAATVYATGTKITAGSPLYFSAGGTANAGLAPGEKAPADMKAQALLTIKGLEKNIANAGFKPSDVAFVRAYLAPGADGTVDYAGWNAAWAETFGSAAMPVKPSRTTIAVPQLGNPATLIEIEYVASAKAAPTQFASASAPVSNAMLKPYYGASTARISSGVGVAPGAALYWTAGVPGDSKIADMKSQARDVLTKLQKNLADVGLTFKDVIFLRCFVGPDKDGKFDTANWNLAYDEFFNNAANPHKPARTTVTTPTYGGAGTLLEVELLAAFPGAPGAQVAFPAGSAMVNGGLKTYGSASSPISSGVAIKPGSSLYFSAGAVANAEGDVKTQALEALNTLKTRMAAAGTSFKDVTFLRAYVVPGADGKLDFPGWTAAYNTFFNNPDQPHKPARTTIGVKSLPRPSMKIEIDVITSTP